MNAEEFSRSFVDAGSESEQDRPAWLRQLQRRAVARFRAVGFPAGNEEEWLGTSLDTLRATAFQLAHPALQSTDEVDRTTAPSVGLQNASVCAILVNGHLHASLGWTAPHPGVFVEGLRDALENHRPWLEPYLARVAQARQSAFTALNTGVFDDVMVIHVAPGVVLKRPIVLQHIALAHEQPQIVTPRVLVVMGGGSEASLVEVSTGAGNAASFVNVVHELVVADDARLSHVRLQREPASGFHIGSLHAHVGARATLHASLLLLEGGMTRDEVKAELTGEGATVRLDALYVPVGRHHVDLRTTVEHAAPHTISRQLYKGVLQDQSRGLFTGRVLVRQRAQKTDAHQANHNLLLSGHALADSKPQLEIYADDVKCRHGATTGRLDESAVFYLRTRGLTEEQSRGLLTLAFAREVLDRLPVPLARDIVSRELAQRWPGSREALEPSPC
ncbi:MAG: Fe-S cluster assembly protein SufD [Polyangiaceae bacterium]|jgi:Fe-S cluster assembly protein SufD|nr:Fe-S cluster assembly protein SufD [Polyangiaceae bacterium]